MLPFELASATPFFFCQGAGLSNSIAVTKEDHQHGYLDDPLLLADTYSVLLVYEIIMCRMSPKFRTVCAGPDQKAGVSGSNPRLHTSLCVSPNRQAPAILDSGPAVPVS